MSDLKAFRRKNNLTQKELANYLGIGNVFICLIETGKSKLPPRLLDKILDNDNDWDTSMFSPSLEPENWIVSENTYSSEYHDTAALKRVGLRIDEVFQLKKGIGCIDYSAFAKKIEFDYVELNEVIAGIKPAPEQLLIKILAAYPDINPCWLCMGIGVPLKQDNKNLK